MIRRLNESQTAMGNLLEKDIDSIYSAARTVADMLKPNSDIRNILIDMIDYEDAQCNEMVADVKKAKELMHEASKYIYRNISEKYCE